MIRLLIFFLWIVFFAAALTFLISAGGVISGEAFGMRFDAPAGVGAAIALALVALAAGTTSMVKDVASTSRTVRARRAAARRERGLGAITKGLEAIAVGDAAQARKQAEIATRLLGASPVTRLLVAQAAQISGDDETAATALAGLLETPETEILALRGLYAKAMREGDRKLSRDYASRAFARHPRARWAFDAEFDLALEANDYTAAREALIRAGSAKTIERSTADRGIAAVLAASAFSSLAAGDEAGALEAAEEALKHSAGLAPAAVLAARLLAARDDLRKAANVLLGAFQAAPERATAEAAESLSANEPPANIAERLDRLAARNPDSREAILVRARANLVRGDASAAAVLIEDCLRSSATARALRLMASAAEAQYGEAAARIWLARAADAPRELSFGADDFHRITAEGWRRLIRDYMDHGRLAPPPFEAPPPGLTDAEFEPVAVRALEAPPTPESKSEDPEADELETREADAARRVN